MKLNEKLIKLRKEKGLSQEEFGNEVNVSRQAVSKWENGESKPDTDKIQEIVKKFNITYEYLLDDEIESMEQTEKVINKKTKRKILLKVIGTIALVYLLFCTYKFIAFCRFYLIANSFSEENFMMFHDFEAVNSLGEITEAFWDTTKVGNKVIEKSGVLDQEEKFTEDGYLNYGTYSITFIDKDKKTSYHLNYDKEKDMYEYEDNDQNIDNEEEYFDTSKNDLKETTLGYIPSSFKEIFLASINPRFYYVSIINREIRSSSMGNDIKVRIQLNSDYLVEHVNIIQEYARYNSTSTFSYDYVQDHFKEIKDPLETYKDKIIFE